MATTVPRTKQSAPRRSSLTLAVMPPSGGQAASRSPGSSRPPLTSSASVGYGRGGPPLTGALFYEAAGRAHDACDLPAAIHLYSTAIALEAEHVGAWVGRGVARKEAGQLEEAISDYTRALALSPSDSTTLLILSNRANCLSALGSHAAALGDHNSAIALNKNDAVLWCNRGSTLLRLGRLDDAAADFTKALEVDTGYAVAGYNLGIVLGRQGRISECTRQFELAGEIFRRTSGNAIHAEDCERQLAYFTGGAPRADTHTRSHTNSPQVTLNQPCSSTPSTPRGSGKRAALEISPLSPVHMRGITRSFPDQPSPAHHTAHSLSSLSPAPTPTSRARLTSHLVASDEAPLSESPPLPPSATGTEFTHLRNLGVSTDQYALFSPSPASSPHHGSAVAAERRTSARSRSPQPQAASTLPAGASASSAPTVPTLTNGQTIPLVSERRNSVPTLVLPRSASGNGSGGGLRSPLSAHSNPSPLSGEPLLVSPTAKRPLPAVKPPNIHGHGKVRTPVRYHTNHGVLSSTPQPQS